MSVILILILASLGVAVAFLAGFIWAVKAGQFDDTCTPGMRILSEDGTTRQTLPGPGDPQGQSERRHAVGLPGSNALSRQHAGAPATQT